MSRRHRIVHLRRASRGEDARVTDATRASAGKPSLLDISARVICGFVVAALVGALLDAVARTSWVGVARAKHAVAAVGLFTAVGAVEGVLGALFCALTGLLPKRGWRTSAAALAAGAAVHATALGLFTGRSARTSGWAKIGPFCLSAAVAVAIGLAAWGVLRALERGQRRVALLALGAAALFFTADLTLFVSLYGRLHTLLELAATFSLVAAFVLGSKAVSGRVVRGVAMAATCWGVFFIASGSLRRAHEDALRTAWPSSIHWRSSTVLPRKVSPTAAAG